MGEITQPTVTVARVAEETLTQFMAVRKGEAANGCEAPDAQGDRATGIVQHNVTTVGDIATVAVLGESMAIAASAIAQDDYLQIAGSSGKLETANPGADVNAEIVGKAIDAASGDGVIFKMLICPFVMNGPGKAA